MPDADYLEGANPYPSSAIEQYTAQGWWLGLTYGDILDRSAARYPDKLAVIDERTRLTYAELRKSVDRFAIALLRLGVRRYDRLLLQLPNRHEFVVAFFAMQRIGAVPVLAIPRHGHREVSYLCSLAEPVGWVVALRDGERDFLPLIETIRAEAPSLRHLIVVGDDPLPPGALALEELIATVELDDHPAGYLQQFRPDPNDVALIMPTGGTTGLVKGVPRTHNSYLASIRHTAEDLRPDDVMGLATPIGHSMAQQGAVGGSIFTGATLALVASPQARTILEAIGRYGITTIGVVPTQIEDMLQCPDFDSYDLSSLRRIKTAGAALRSESAAKAEELFAGIGARFDGGEFGSSEGPAARHYPDESPEVFRTSVGRPMCPGDRWKVIDEEERELPPNVEGELAARGPLVFTGYYKSDAENREIFTADGYYRMGDLGKIDEEGHIFVTGRKKDVIQRGGEGIVPSEMERLISMHPSVDAAAVVGIPDPRLGEKACAYVALKPARTLSLEELTAFLRGLGAGKLLLPERLETVEALARTALGKVDKKALRADVERKLRQEGVL